MNTDNMTREQLLIAIAETESSIARIERETARINQAHQDLEKICGVLRDAGRFTNTNTNTTTNTEGNLYGR